MSIIKEDRGTFDETIANMFGSLTYKNSYLFYAHMVSKCSIKIDRNLPAPAGVSYITNHYNLYINPDLFDTFTLPERLAILKHEMLHILNNHVLRTEDRIHLPWNLSTDCAINQFIDDLPENCVLPSNFPVENCPLKMTAEFYYDLLKDNVDFKEESGIENIDTHETWQESSGDKDLQKDITKQMIEKSRDDTLKNKGDVPYKINDWLDLHSRKSEVNWKKVLRLIIGNKKVSKRVTIMKRDRRLPGRDDLRGKTKDRKFNLLLVSDVSGSVDDDALLSLLSEVKNICDVTGTSIDLIQVDSSAHDPEKLSKATKIINRKSRGGTNLHPALEKAKEFNIDFNAIVVTTDGFLFKDDINKFKETNKRVVWLIEKSGKILPEMNQGKMTAIKLK